MVPALTKKDVAKVTKIAILKIAIIFLFILNIFPPYLTFQNLIESFFRIAVDE